MNIYNSSKAAVQNSLSLSFNYSKISFDEFKNEFEKLDDKTISYSHPLANIVKAVARAAALPFVVLLSPIFGLNAVKFQAFTLVRELQETAGAIVAKFNLAKGAYLIREAQFHIQAYASVIQANVRFQNIMRDIPNRPTLEDFDMTDALRFEKDMDFLKPFVQKPSASRSSYSIDLFQWNLDKFCHSDGNEIARHFDVRSEILYELLSQEQKDQIDYEVLAEHRASQLFTYKKDRLNALKPNQVLALLNKKPDLALDLTNQALVKQIDLSKLNLKALVKLLSNVELSDVFDEERLLPFLDDLVLMYDEIRNDKVRKTIVSHLDRIGLNNFKNLNTDFFTNIKLLYDLNIGQLQSVVKDWFNEIPVRLLEKLDLTHVPFVAFLCAHIKPNYRSYWKLVPLSLVESHLEMIPDNAWEHISQEVIKKIDFSKLPIAALNTIPNTLPLPLIQEKLEEFPESFWNCLDQEKIDTLDFSNVTDKFWENFPFKKIPISVLQKNIKRIGAPVWEALPADRIAKLDFRLLGYSSANLPHRVIRLIPPDQINAIYLYIPEKIIWFTFEQCRSLMGKDISSDILNDILLVHGRNEKLFEGFDINDFVPKIDPLKFISSLHPATKAKIDISKLTPEQRRYYGS